MFKEETASYPEDQALFVQHNKYDYIHKVKIPKQHDKKLMETSISFAE